MTDPTHLTGQIRTMPRSAGVCSAALAGRHVTSPGTGSDWCVLCVRLIGQRTDASDQESR